MIADIILKIAGMQGEEEGNHAYYPRPSLAGPDRCIRQMVFWAMGIPREPLPGRAVMIFDDSSFHEDLTGDWIRKSAFQLHSEQMEVDIGEQYGIHLKGHIDGIITDLSGTDIHFEHKAINHFTFQKYWSGEVPMDYVTQTCLYNLGLKNDNPDIDQSILLIKNKNTAQYLEYLIEYRAPDTATIIQRTNSQGETIEMGEVIERITENAFRKFAEVKKYAEEKRLPKRQYDIDNWHCEYCGWKEKCWDNWEAEFEQLKTNEMLPSDVADMVRYYRELGGQKSDIDKEYKSLASQIKALMKDNEMREGRTDEYVCRLRLEHRDEYVVPAKTIEKLDIRKVKEANHGNGSV
jgi:CRISPR/Cas system-associated exonuclease Cas4 (RecB family)